MQSDLPSFYRYICVTCIQPQKKIALCDLRAVGVGETSAAWHTNSVSRPNHRHPLLLFYPPSNHYNIRKAVPITIARELLEDQSNHVEDYGRWCA